ncbi:hypothetical protein K502DRAFT_350892 [Neoconidiobolus thromboides FSU 785]|nr:hypothetical protein K502DRAFT_350892 [Neoconidiobolus thromboides FSU 785]
MYNQDDTIVSINKDDYVSQNQILVIFSLTLVLHINVLINSLKLVKNFPTPTKFVLLVIAATACICHFDKLSDYFINIGCEFRPRLNYSMYTISCNLSDLLIVLLNYTVYKQILKRKYLYLLLLLNILTSILSLLIRTFYLSFILSNITGILTETKFCSAKLDLIYFTSYIWSEWYINLVNLLLLGLFISIVFIIYRFHLLSLFQYRVNENEEKQIQQHLTFNFVYYFITLLCYIPMISTNANLSHGLNDVFFHVRWSLQSVLMLYWVKNLAANSILDKLNLKLGLSSGSERTQV